MPIIRRIRSRLAGVIDNERGQALVEYALILGLVALTAIGTLTLLGANIASFLDFIQSKVGAIVPGS